MVFERNPLPGSAPARHLEPDALILARFGAVRGQIGHKTHFSENSGATFRPKMFRAQIVRGNVGQGRILRGIFLSRVLFYLSAPTSGRFEPSSHQWDIGGQWGPRQPRN